MAVLVGGQSLRSCFSLLTFTSPDSFSLYWSPVTQPSSSSKLVTVPSKTVTLEEEGVKKKRTLVLLGGVL